MRRISGAHLVITFIILTVAAIAFAAAVQYGQQKGFRAGSEWALMQANIMAREAGEFMPVYMKDGKIRLVIRQPRGLYKRAWQAADRYDDAKVRNAKAQMEATTAKADEEQTGGKVGSQL